MSQPAGHPKLPKHRADSNPGHLIANSAKTSYTYQLDNGDAQGVDREIIIADTDLVHTYLVVPFNPEEVLSQSAMKYPFRQSYIKYDVVANLRYINHIVTIYIQ